MTKARHWLRRIASALVAVLLCGAVALFVGVTVLPRFFGIELRTVVSGSMEPVIDKGALIVATPASFDSLRPGDIIVFRAPDNSGRVITHRVAGLRDANGVRLIETRGDANNGNDPWTVASSDVLGKVQGNIPYAGYAVQDVRSPAGFVLLMLLPGLFVLAGEASVWRRFLRDRKGGGASGRAREAVASEYVPRARSIARGPRVAASVIVPRRGRRHDDRDRGGCRRDVRHRAEAGAARRRGARRGRDRVDRPAQQDAGRR